MPLWIFWPPQAHCEKPCPFFQSFIFQLTFYVFHYIDTQLSSPL